MLTYGFNEACKNISAKYLKVGDESMGAISFQTTVKGNLAHLSCIFYSPESLGTEFNKIACSIKGDLIFIELHRGEEGMQKSKHNQNLGATAA